MAKFQKGTSGNPNGRPYGSENKTTKETRTLLINILNKNFEDIPELLNKITDPEKKLNLILKFLPYIIPRLDSAKYYNFEPDVWD